MAETMRMEHDIIGELSLPADVLYGIHTARAIENFPITARRVNPGLIRSYGIVKLACITTARAAGAWSGAIAKADAIERSCREMADGTLSQHIVVDALQGGAGTSTNMNINEVIANRALILLGHGPGEYTVVSPMDDINIYQSTNDTYPTALKVAAIRSIRHLEEKVVGITEAFQMLEKKFAHVVKVGRTQYQDAVLVTLGREMGAYADAFARDRWRIYKCEERLRVVNLGGTAIGTGLAAPRKYIFKVVDTLRELTGIGLARAENLVDATQNTDVFVEVSGILKALAATLLKVSSDLRLLSSGPEAGIGEIMLPKRQAGSSIMPGKINPVIPEAATQVCLSVMANDQTIAMASAMGSLELNAFLPVIADCLLGSCDMLVAACDMMRRFCVEGIEADEAKCRAHVENSTAAATALIPHIGYDAACEIVIRARKDGLSIRDAAIESGMVTSGEFDQLTAPEAVSRLGSPDIPG